MGDWDKADAAARQEEMTVNRKRFFMIDLAFYLMTANLPVFCLPVTPDWM
jgi:hypothetical protein